MIVKATEDTQIPPGKYVCFGSSTTPHLLCGEPKCVTHTIGKQVYFKEPGGVVKYKLQKSVVFVCDTRDEAEIAYNMSRSLHAEALIQADELKFRLNTMFNSAIENLVRHHAQ